MVRDVKTCSPEDRLDRVAQILWENDCGVAPVVDREQRVVGMITDRDVCMAAYTKGLSLGAIRVEEVMSREVHSCRPQDDVAVAEERMRSRHVRRVPVIDRGYLVGILSLHDLAQRAVRARTEPIDGLALEEVAETFAAICQPWRDLAARDLGAGNPTARDPGAPRVPPPATPDARSHDRPA